MLQDKYCSPSIAKITPGTRGRFRRDLGRTRSGGPLQYPGPAGAGACAAADVAAWQLGNDFDMGKDRNTLKSHRWDMDTYSLVILGRFRASFFLLYGSRMPITILLAQDTPCNTSICLIVKIVKSIFCFLDPFLVNHNIPIYPPFFASNICRIIWTSGRGCTRAAQPSPKWA